MFEAGPKDDRVSDMQGTGRVVDLPRARLFSESQSRQGLMGAES